MTKRVVFMFSLIILSGMPAMTWVLAGERFVDNGDGTVTDLDLNLMWAKTDNQGDIDWHQANQWAKFTYTFTLQKIYDNWRLPTTAELVSLVEKTSAYETDCGQKAHINPIFRLSCGWVWTSETDPIAPTARVFNFDNIYHYTVRKAHSRGYRALAVRNLEQK